MSNSVNYVLRQVTRNDLPLMHALLTTFGQVFGETATYCENRPTDEYMRTLLGCDYFIALVATRNGIVIGGLAAYELKKFEQQRSEIYIYDLAVLEEYRRKGVASALISELKRIAANRGAYVILVQSDMGVEDRAAIALYSKFGIKENVLHFDIPVSEFLL